MKEKTSKTTYDLRIKGVLKLESQVIKTLKIICISTFLLSVAIQYIIPMFFATPTLEVINYQFIINVLLGIACSALISLVVLWIPFVSKKENQHTKLIALVKRVFFDYEKLLAVIDCNADRNDKENTYLGEFLLINATKKLEQDSNNLICEYEKSDVMSKNIEKIIDGVDEFLIPTTQVVSKFFDLIMPKEYKDNPDDVFFVKINKNFDKEENVSLYNQLSLSLGEILPSEHLFNLFSDYIAPSQAEFEMLKNDTQEQLEKIKKHTKQKRVFSIQNKLFIEVMKIQHEFLKKRMKKE